MSYSQEAIESTSPAAQPSILLVDDSESVRSSLGMVLQHNGFAVVEASNVREALQLIASRSFDVLLSDLHMPHAGDGLTVVSAMRHSNPDAVTLIFSGYPGMREAASAILLQADEVMVKPLAVNRLVETIRERMRLGKPPARTVESMAAILEHEAAAITADWLKRVAREPALHAVRLDDGERSAHLPQLIKDIVARLQDPTALGTHTRSSPSAAAHGYRRRQQGYSPSMIVEESRMLQVSLFQALENNMHTMDFSMVLPGVMAIADEVDAQLAQSLESYIEQTRIGVAC